MFSVGMVGIQVSSGRGLYANSSALASHLKGPPEPRCSMSHVLAFYWSTLDFIYPWDKVFASLGQFQRISRGQPSWLRMIDTDQCAADDLTGYVAI